MSQASIWSRCHLIHLPGSRLRFSFSKSTTVQYEIDRNKMAYFHRVINADELRSILSHHPNGGKDDQIHVELALFQPLLDQSILAACRNPDASYTEDIQPYVYRAPEVILDIPWSYPMDIWNVGVMVRYHQVVTKLVRARFADSTQIWDLFEKQHLFSAQSPSDDQSSEYHLAEMYAILGPPPLDYLQRTETSWEHFEVDGTCKDLVPIPNLSLETSERSLNGDNKARFLDFVRKMLQWVPEKRHTAKQLLEDTWLND